MAFIQPANVVLSFNGGLQGKQDEVQQQPPSLLTLENAIFNKVGRLNKRFGYDVLSTNVMDGDSILNAFAIDNFNQELNLFDNQNIYTFISSNNNWANRGTAISLINSNKQVIRTSAAQQLNPDAAYLNGIEVFVWEDSRSTGGCRYSVIDKETASFCIADQPILGSLSNPKVIVFNNFIYVFYNSRNNIYFRYIDTDNPSFISDQTVIAADGYASDFVYDVVVSNDKLYVSYFADTVASGSLELVYIDTDNSVNTAATVVASGAVNDNTFAALNLASDSVDQLWVSWSNGTQVRYAVFDTSSGTSVVLASTLIEEEVVATLSGIESSSAGVLQLVYELQATAAFVDDEYIVTQDQKIKAQTLTNAGDITEVATLRSVGLASKAFTYNGNLYVNVVHETPLQSTYLTILINSPIFGTVVSKVNAQVSGGLSTNGLLPEVSTISSGIFLWPNLVKGQFISEDNTNFSLLGVNATTTDFTNINKFNSVTQSNNLLFVGGILQNYDGVSVTEQNFHVYPEGTVLEGFTTGGALSQGQYQYRVVYAWTDKFGQIQYSTPSTAVQFECSTATGSALLNIPTLRVTAKTNVVIKVYRTQVNGVVFQEVTSELAPLLNDPTVDFVQFADVVADAQMAANATLYTTGGVLANTAPPSCSLIALYQDRVMLAGLEDSNLIWFSKNKVNATNFNTIPVEFASENSLAISPLGGPITALATMDDKLIIFKKSSIYVLSGDGPNDVGGGNSFPPVELVSNSVGCTNPNSVVLTKNGLMFQSVKGIWLLDRSLGEPQYIGAGVDDIAKDHIISSAVVDPNDNHIIFTTFDEKACVYDYYNNQWTTFTNHNSIDGIVFNGKYMFCKANGQVYQQNRTKFTDGERKIEMSFTTPWLSFAQMLGYQRVFRAFILGEFKGPHDLTISVGYDFNPFFEDGYTIPATTIAGANLWGGDTLWGSSDPWGGTFYPYQFQINFQRQTCTSLRLRVTDTQTSPFGEGYTISNLSFEVGVLPGSNRLPKRNKVGTQ